jgi:hypothetical protein
MTAQVDGEPVKLLQAAKQPFPVPPGDATKQHRFQTGAVENDLATAEPVEKALSVYEASPSRPG